jgi:sigma-E factor negative regulatory protein RseC
MDEIGIIKSVNGPVAIVSLTRRSACDDCKAGCKLTESEAEVETINEAHAMVGQRVRVVMKPYSYLKGSLLVYGAPALALIAGAVVGKDLLSPYFKNADPDIISAISGFGAFLISFVLVKVVGSKIEKNTAYKPVVREIIEG